MVEAIDAALTRDPSVEILGPSSTDNSKVDALHLRRKIYLIDTYIGIQLGGDLTPIEA